MGELVWAACTSHAGGQLRVPENADEQDRIDRVYAGWERLRRSLAEAGPDALVVIGTDHMLTFSFDLMPIFTIGRGERYETWGEVETGRRDVAGVPALSDSLHAGLVADGFDVAGSVEMRLDHSYSCPLAFLDPEKQLPVVPLSVDVFAPPLPSFRRCRSLGESLRAGIERQQDVARVAILATGGISHWVGVPDTGRIEPQFDLSYLDRFEQADVDALDRIDVEEFARDGGPGACEALCWAVAMGAAGSLGGERLVYEPIKAWITGIALVAMEVE